MDRGKDGAAFALFPTIPGTLDPTTCSCYQHIGQHCAAYYAGCILTSRPATDAEAADLLAELRTIGYNPMVVKRATPAMRAARLAALKL
jgi:hypothetical protein